MGWLGAIVTPETEMLKAQMRSVDTELADQERLAGSAIQESREEMRKRRRATMNTLGSYGGSSTDFYQMLSGIEAGQKAEEDSISQETMMDQAAAARMKRQLAEVIPIRQAQETWGAVKDTVGTVAQVAAPFLGPAGIPVAMAGAALSRSPDPGSAGLGVQELQDQMRYGSPAEVGGKPATGMYTEQMARPGLAAGQAAGAMAGNQGRIDRLMAMLQLNPGDAGIIAQLAQLGVML
jgi:hypothetical protein